MSAISYFVVQRLYAAWREPDVPAVLECCTDDVTYSVYMADRGERRDYRGRCEVSAYLIAVAAAWELVELETRRFRFDPESGSMQCRVWFNLRHRATGRELAGSRRHTWHVRDGLVCYCGESGDTGLIRAFRRMVEAPR